MNNSHKFKLGFFFGAGAEVGYGMPLGGRFALDIFRQETNKEKEKFRKILSQVKINSPYAKKWLPENFNNKNIYTFSKRELRSLLESTIEYNKNTIIDFLDNFDYKANQILNDFSLTEEEVRNIFENKTGAKIETIDYHESIKINSAFQANTKLFKNNYFSSFLKIYTESNQQENILLSKVIESFLQLLIGCYASKLASNLNEVFTESPELPFFNDFHGLFHIDLSRAGLNALELVIDKNFINKTVDNNSKIEDIFSKLGFKILEKLVEQTLDYKQLVDSNFRYLSEPKVEWAKFTKMAVFLETVYSYIKNSMNQAQAKDDGYYHDLLEKRENIEIFKIGITNYTNLIKSIIPNSNPAYLNGSIDDYYDPYLNKIIKFDSEKERLEYPQLTIPLIFIYTKWD